MSHGSELEPVSSPHAAGEHREEECAVWHARTGCCHQDQPVARIADVATGMWISVRGGSAASVMRARRAFAPSPRRQRMSVLKLFFLCRTMYLISDMSKPVISDDFLTPQRPPPSALRRRAGAGRILVLASWLLAITICRAQHYCVCLRAETRPAHRSHDDRRRSRAHDQPLTFAT